MRRAWLGTVPLAAFVACVFAAPATAELSGVGAEAAVGMNATGEACRIRVTEEEAGRGYQRLSLFCDGWSSPSGTLHRFRAPRDYTPARLLTDSTFQRGYETRLGNCGPVEPTMLGDGTAAAVRPCVRLERGWPMIVIGAVAGGRGYGFEAFPTNARMLEAVIAVLHGQVPRDGRDGKLSAAIRRAETMVGATGALVGIQDIGAAETLWRLGHLQYRSGNYAAGETSFARLLEIHNRVLGPNRPGVVAILSELALCIGHQGRYDEADRVFALAEAGVPGSLADEHMILLAYRASVHRDHRPPEGLVWAEQAAKIADSRPQTSRARAYTVGMHAVLLRTNKRLAEAELQAANSIRLTELPGNDPEWRLWWAGEMHELLGRIYADQRRHADARREYELGLTRRELLFGESGARTIEALAALGVNEVAAGDVSAGLQYHRRAAALQLRHRPALEGARVPGALAYLDALARAADERPTERAALAAETFVALQIPRGTETAKALRAMAARIGAGDARLAAITRQLQDAGRERTIARIAVAEVSMRPPEQQQRAEELKRQLRDAETRVEKLEGRLQAEFPRYAALSGERPLFVDEAKALLHDDEALAVFLPGIQTTFVAVVRRDGVRAYRARIGRTGLEGEIKALRESLDLSDGTAHAFDVGRARRLHDTLLGPAAATLAGVRHLLTVPAGPLLSLPLGVLVTRDAPAAADYRTVPFLAADLAISVLPSAAALRELRSVAARSSAPEPFIGFADPAFDGGRPDRRGIVDLANACRQGEPADPALLGRLPRLPESADELRRIGASLGAGRDAVVVGPDASERRVRATDLARYRVVAFATHGLLPGELRCQAEPALALTPPPTPSRDDDGLLDASEVATLKLDADWVVLSACNTAGPDGSLGGESLSGLTRAFFYAGARALLVTHWSVASGPTVTLTTGLFDIDAREPGVGKAEALRRSQLALRARLETAHPFFWAPFVVVGDGGPTR